MQVDLSPVQLDLIEQRRRIRMEAIQSERDPRKIYKWNVSAFVKDEITLTFRKGSVLKAEYDGIDLGMVHLKVQPSESHSRFRIVNVEKFKQLLEDHQEFVLSISHSSGIDKGWFVKAYDSRGHEFADISDYERMSLDVG